MHILIYLILALLPTTFYMVYISAFDKYKPEPLYILVLTAFLGALEAMLVITLEELLYLDKPYLMAPHKLTESFLVGFLQLAAPADLFKWALLCILFPLNKYYDEFIDGIIYSVCLAMGFAGIWVVWLVSDTIWMWDDIQVAAFVLIPLLFLSGAVMGYFFALARSTDKILNYALALLVPFLIDGLMCSFILAIGNNWVYYFFIGIALAVLSMFVYTQVFRLLEMDGLKAE